MPTLTFEASCRVSNLGRVDSIADRRSLLNGRRVRCHNLPKEVITGPSLIRVDHVVNSKSDLRVGKRGRRGIVISDRDCLGCCVK